MRSDHSNIKGVVVTSGGSPSNSLGVIRGFGRRGIPVIYLDSLPTSIVRYSKYISSHIKCPSSNSESAFIKILLNFGKQTRDRMMIIPTGDNDVLALSKYKCELEQFYHLPVSTYKTVHNLLNKKKFYKLLAEMNIPHPKTYFPKNLNDLRSTGQRVAYPYIIKPANSLAFREEFGKKCFVINSTLELDQAISKLKDKNLEVMIQEIIPGNKIYVFYTYFNAKSEPLAACGYDKIRQYPLDFGSGTFCKSIWRSSPINECFRLLKEIKYHGFAEPEFKMDPRDKKYKLLEINPRTTLQNRLASAFGVDIEYIAYLDALGQFTKKSFSFRKNVLWSDDFQDLRSCFSLLRRGEFGRKDIPQLLNIRTVHTIAAWDDPLPIFFDITNFFRARFKSPANG